MESYTPYREVLYVLKQKNMPTPWAISYHHGVIKEKYPDLKFYTSYVLLDKENSEYLIVVNYRTGFAYLYPNVGYDGRIYHKPRDFRRHVGFTSRSKLQGGRYVLITLDEIYNNQLSLLQ